MAKAGFVARRRARRRVPTVPPAGFGRKPRRLTPARRGRAAAQSVDLYSRRLGVPVTLPEITLDVAFDVSQLRIVEYDALP